MNTDCGGADDKHAPASELTLEVRFQDTATAQAQGGTGLRQRPTADAPGPATDADVASILVDITPVASGQPFYTNFALAQSSPDVWRGDVPLLPRNQQLHFAARALTAAGEVAFSGETLATLTADNTDLEIPLAPPQNGQTFQMPRMVRIVYPDTMVAGQPEQIAFTIEGNAGTSIGIQVTPSGSQTPAPEFSPATGTVVLGGTVADFMAVYTPPQVTADTDVDYQVTITAASPLTAVAIATDFKIHVKPPASGLDTVAGTQLDVQLSPVILSMTANGSETPGTVQLVAAVSDGTPATQLAYQWSYAPDVGTPAVSFAANGQGNPGLFQGYTLADQGTLTLVVSDGQTGATTLHYQLKPNQFANAIDTSSTQNLKRIVAGAAHTCVITGQDRVHCWGDNQFGQLGYGNTIDLGDSPGRLPYTAGDVPLPVGDPVVQVAAGNNHTCALLQSGLMYCWGDNQFGQLGYGRIDNLADNEPVTSFGVVQLGELAIVVAAGGDHTCAVLQTGALRCWGRNDFGQLGRGNTQNLGDDKPPFSAGDLDLGAGVTVKDVALGQDHTCALLATGAVRCWGRNDFGQLGYGNTNNLGDDEPINDLADVALTGAVRKLVAGNAHTCALTVAGTLRCWGRGDSGQLGQSITGDDTSWGNEANELPSNLAGDIKTGAQVTDVAAGAFHTCALSSDGQLKCWGRGDSGQLGDGDLNNLAAPPATGVDLDGTTAYQLAAGAADTCALRSDGTARCWGAGDDGQLGLGDTNSSSSASGGAIQVFAPVPACGDGTLDAGEQCDDGNTIDADGCEHNCTLPACGNGILDSGEQCDDGNAANGDGCENNCTLPRCGNGIVDLGEQCDDGNASNGDGCENTCTLPRCGNGIIDVGEQCDDGNTTNGDTCDNNCTMPRCGNAILDPGEQCDDGNTTNSDGCEANCTLPKCGNAILDPGEQCDDGNTTNSDGCEANCTLPRCGNGILDPGEQCDDGNTINSDGCEANCTLPKCGNDILDPGEQCDDGNTTNSDGCEANCTLPKCGNGILDPGEQCDDGNTTNSDGCEANCTLPRCGNGILDPGEQCDDGNTTNSDGCEANCTLPRCGNGILDPGEQCDDGNTNNNDSCRNNCTLPPPPPPPPPTQVCGNGIKEGTEQCDDGNNVNGDGCEANCTLPVCGNGIIDSGEQCDDGNANNADGCDTLCRALPVGCDLVSLNALPSTSAKVVTAAYCSVLHRVTDGGDPTAMYASELDHPSASPMLTPANFLLDFCNSPEFATTITPLTVPEYVNLLFARFLFRQPSGTDLSFYTTALGPAVPGNPDSGFTRPQVCQFFTISSEFNSKWTVFDAFVPNPANP